jgi:peptide/nickel transport system substrate-binding protein
VPGRPTPWQPAARPESEQYDEEMAKQFTEYDVDLANQYLDDAGYEMDSNGRRIGPDGEPITIIMDYANDVNNDWTDALELVQGYWNEVGVRMELNGISRSLHTELVRENGEHEATVWTGSGGLVPFMQTHWYFPSTLAADFASAWGEWYMNPDNPNAEEPPEGPRRQMELYDQILSTVDSDEQVALMRELLGILKEEFYSIGISLPPEGIGVVVNNMHNVPDHMYNSTSWPTPGPSNTIQYFFEE